VIDEA